ncbi:uncharacterized protein LOC106981970 [Acinonyx jubatus]|uniref:Uncharacterized protein LOC106981970 n=1 Tax=Acinonyx jubatus TaxID=32536 RepID=A0ABM3Q926_ACIJB|nr:uncharacterized protein LOC106981970 [Acinonyx jubatus]
MSLLEDGEGRLRDSPVLISGLISFGQGDTARSPRGRGRRPKGEPGDPRRRAGLGGERGRAFPPPPRGPAASDTRLPTRARSAQRSLERHHVAARPAVRVRAPSPPGTHGAARPGLALIPPRRLSPGSARRRPGRNPYGNRPPPRTGLGGAAAPRLPFWSGPPARLRGRALGGGEGWGA